ELLREPFRVEVGIKGHIRSRKIVDEFAAGQPQPLQSLRVVNNESAIKADGFSLEEIGKRIVGAGWSGHRFNCSRRTATAGYEAAGEVDPTGEILIRIAFHSQAQADARAIAVHSTLLEETLTADSHISAPAEAAECRFQSAELFLLILGGKRRIGGVGLHIFHVALDLTHGGVALLGSLLRRRRFAL